MSQVLTGEVLFWSAVIFFFLANIVIVFQAHRSGDEIEWGHFLAATFESITIYGGILGFDLAQASKEAPTLLRIYAVGACFGLIAASYFHMKDSEYFPFF